MSGKQGVLIVLCNNVEGLEEQYNHWYSHEHLRDMLKIPGFTTAQRFKATAGAADQMPPKWKYLAIYGAQTDTPQQMIDDSMRRAATRFSSGLSGAASATPLPH